MNDEIINQTTEQLTEEEERLIKLGKAQRDFKRKYRFRTFGHSLISDATFILFIVIAVIVILNSFSMVTVRGDGMGPTLRENNILVINKRAYSMRLPQRGDIVVTKDDRIFRVIGLPGETIELYSGTIYINGEPVNETYRVKNNDTSPVGRNKSFDTGEDGYFLLSDDRKCFDDSRRGQLYKLSDFSGKVAFKW